MIEFSIYIWCTLSTWFIYCYALKIHECGIWCIRTGYKRLLGKVLKFGKSVLTLIHPPSQCDCCVQQLVSEQAFRKKPNSLKGIRRHTMDNKEEDTKEEKEEKVCTTFDNVLVFDETDYFGWRAKMKAYLKKYGVWQIVINVAVPNNKKSKAANQK